MSQIPTIESAGNKIRLISYHRPYRLTPLEAQAFAGALIEATEETTGGYVAPGYKPRACVRVSPQRAIQINHDDTAVILDHAPKILLTAKVASELAEAVAYHTEQLEEVLEASGSDPYPSIQN